MLKSIYDKKEDIPEAYRDLYSERDGKWEVTGIEGTHPQSSVDRLEGALARAKTERNELKTQLDQRGDATPESVRALQDENEELKTKLEMAGKTPEDFETKLSELADRRAATKVAPVQRELETAQGRIAELEKSNGDLASTVLNRDIDDDLRAVASELKVVPTAIDDVLMHRTLFEKSDTGAIVGRDGVGILPGVSPRQWMLEMQKTRPHWWAQSQGGGATGGGPTNGLGSNPWSAKNWSTTAQGQYVRAHGVDKAREAATAAGSSLGAPYPPTTD